MPVGSKRREPTHAFGFPPSARQAVLPESDDTERRGGILRGGNALGRAPFCLTPPQAKGSFRADQHFQRLLVSHDAEPELCRGRLTAGETPQPPHAANRLFVEFGHDVHLS